MSGTKKTVLLHLATAFLLMIFFVSVVSSADTDPSEECDELYNSGAYANAGDCYLTLDPPDFLHAAISYEWAGISAEAQGDYNDGLNFALLAANYHVTSDGKGGAYYHAGFCAYQLSDYADAEYYFSISGDYLKNTNNLRAAISYEWAGISAEAQGDYNDGLNFALLAANYHVTSDGKGGAYYHAGFCAYQLSDYADAEYYFSISGDYLKNTNNLRAAISYEWAGNAAKARNDCPVALAYWVKAKEQYNLAGKEYTIPGPVILVSPTQVQFFGTEVKAVQITNQGQGDCPLVIEKLSLVGDQDFEIVEDFNSIYFLSFLLCTEGDELEPEESCSILIRFDPKVQGQKMAVLLVESSDPMTSEEVVPLFGFAFDRIRPQRERVPGKDIFKALCEIGIQAPGCFDGGIPGGWFPTPPVGTPPIIY